MVGKIIRLLQRPVHRTTFLLVTGTTLLGVAALVLWVYVRNDSASWVVSDSATKTISSQTKPHPGLANTFPTDPSIVVASRPPLDVPNFNPLTHTPIKPAFLHDVLPSHDISVSLKYEDPLEDHVHSAGSPDSGATVYTDPATGLGYYLIPRESVPKKSFYGSDYPIFRATESHSYQGTPIVIRNSERQYTLTYIGLKISDRQLVSHLAVELGVDFREGDVGEIDTQDFFTRLFSPSLAYACGPGLYLREVGSSDLTFIEELEGVAWYALAKPIALHDLPKRYCDDPQDMYCGMGEETGGSLRMHIFYTPNDRSGFLQVQLADVIFKDANSQLFEPAQWQNYTEYYRASFPYKEEGSVSFAHDTRNGALGIKFTNTGQDDLFLDTFSFNVLRNYFGGYIPHAEPGVALTGISVKNARTDGVVASATLDDILTSVKGRKLIRGQSLTYPLIQAAALSPDTLYSVDTEVGIPAPSITFPQKGLVSDISWSIDGEVKNESWRDFPTEGGIQRNVSLLYVDSNRNIEINILHKSLFNLFCKKDDVGVLRAPIALLSFDASSSIIAHMPLLQVNTTPFSSKYSSDSNGCVSVKDIQEQVAETKITVNIVHSTLVDFMSDLDTTFHIVSHQSDREPIIEYRRGSRIGYAKEVQIATSRIRAKTDTIVVVYEFPSVLFEDSTSRQYAEWLWKTNPYDPMHSWY